MRKCQAKAVIQPAIGESDTEELSWYFVNSRALERRYWAVDNVSLFCQMRRRLISRKKNHYRQMANNFQN